MQIVYVYTVVYTYLNIYAYIFSLRKISNIVHPTWIKSVTASRNGVLNFVSVPCHLHCNTLQHNFAATHCSVLQCVVVYCSLPQSVALCLASKMPLCCTPKNAHHTVTHSSTRQHTATHCNTQQKRTRVARACVGARFATQSLHAWPCRARARARAPSLRCRPTAHDCVCAYHGRSRAWQQPMPPRPARSVFQCVAVWCNVVQCVVVCCTMLQCFAVCCRQKLSVCVYRGRAGAWQQPTPPRPSHSVLQRVAVCWSVIHVSHSV